MGYAGNSVYWVGNDGNVWYRSGDTTRNVGKPVNLQDSGFDSQFLSAEASRINDPNPQQSGPGAPPSNPNGTRSGAGGYVAPPKPDKSNDIKLQLAGLAAVDQQTGSGISSIDQALGRLQGQYDVERDSNEKNYTDQSVTNQTNLQKNKQTAFVNASQGRQGLFGTLSSLGALSGDGITLANRAVQKGANDDLSGAADSFSGNQQQLDTAVGQFRQEDKMRRDNASTSAENARTNVRNQAAKSRMSFYSNLANDHSEMGNAGEAKRYSELASSLYPEMAKTSVPNSEIAYRGAAFTPGTLASYMAGADNTTVTATPTQPGSTIPGLVAGPTKKKQLQLA